MIKSLGSNLVNLLISTWPSSGLTGVGRKLFGSSNFSYWLAFWILTFDLTLFFCDLLNFDYSTPLSKPHCYGTSGVETVMVGMNSTESSSMSVRSLITMSLFSFSSTFRFNCSASNIYFICQDRYFRFILFWLATRLVLTVCARIDSILIVRLFIWFWVLNYVPDINLMNIYFINWRFIIDFSQYFIQI